jgi:hypothetical protein
MDRLSKNIKVNISREGAFLKFIEELHNWWPKGYTWSQDCLVDIRIDAEINGLCSEIGPNNFRCDWGTVIEIEDGKLLVFKWQIGPSRSPVPDPSKSSTVRLIFSSVSDFETSITLEHIDFQNHGEGYSAYLAGMNSDKGWDYILNCFVEYCNK